MELHLEAFDTIATGLLRDAEGGWIRGYCRRLGVCSAMRAELWEIHNRLLIAWREGYMKVLLESDRSLAIHLIKNISGEGAHAPLARNIIQLCKKEWEVQ
ncbi:hypothetical protein J1N35_030573 [Gossypium stocksii]|uniref:RNase H type-1 domain-containing protein n=1 Tax=Gossypium stocksii TaxID=47602 RepID=A0A9D3ZT22_9ROSI|nr:hypothetical protein J1N35_030573 [Gossypium stocksii]